MLGEHIDKLKCRWKAYKQWKKQCVDARHQQRVRAVSVSVEDERQPHHHDDADNTHTAPPPPLTLDICCLSFHAHPFVIIFDDESSHTLAKQARWSSLSQHDQHLESTWRDQTTCAQPTHTPHTHTPSSCDDSVLSLSSHTPVTVTQPSARTARCASTPNARINLPSSLPPPHMSGKTSHIHTNTAHTNTTSAPPQLVNIATCPTQCCLSLAHAHTHVAHHHALPHRPSQHPTCLRPSSRLC